MIDINGKIEQWHEPRHGRHERQLNVKQVKPEAESKVKAQKAKEEASKRKKKKQNKKYQTDEKILGHVQKQKSWGRFRLDADFI